MWLLCNLIDALSSKRHWMHQTNLMRLITSPVNTITHIGTPTWLRGSLTDGNGVLEAFSVFPNRKKLIENFPQLLSEAEKAKDYFRQMKNEPLFSEVADEGWKRFHLKWYGGIDPLAKKLCPITCSILESLPEVKTGMFSLLEPKSQIKPHYGFTKMVLRYHLGITTPNSDECFLDVNGSRYAYKDGEDIVFDDTRLHFVENNTLKKRLILHLDIERPTTGPLRLLNKAFIDYLGPLTRRRNDESELI